MEIFKNKKFYLIGLAIVIVGLFFAVNVSLAQAAECEEKSEQSLFQSYFNPLISFAEKTVNGFGYDVALAAVPDSDICGSDSVGCSESTPTATISWTKMTLAGYSFYHLVVLNSGWTLCAQGDKDNNCAFSGTKVVRYGANSCGYIYGNFTNGVLCYKDSFGVGDPCPNIYKHCDYASGLDFNVPSINTTSHAISSGLASGTFYNWLVEAYYNGPYGKYPSKLQGVTNQPYGSFTAPGCSTLSVVITANPMSGTAPLNTTLTANVSGTATGSVNYSFWWNCDNNTTSIAAASGACGSLPAPVSGTCVANANGAKCNDISATSQSVNHIYSSTGNYRPKVIVERGAASPAQDLTDAAGLPNSPSPGGPGDVVIVTSSPILTVSITGTGTGVVTSNPSGINCGSDCTETYAVGTPVTLTAIQAGNSVFAGWSGDADCSDGMVTMDVSKTCVAAFNVVAADFLLSNSNSIYATILEGQPGDSTETTITVIPFNGFSSPVVLSVQSVSPSLPGGSTFSFIPSTLNSSQYSSGSQFKVHIGAGATPGSYDITVQGVGAGLTRTVIVNLNVQIRNPSWEEI